MSKHDSKHTRSNLLKAANALLLEQGATALTLEAVAARAGVSKGGLLYHFPSKDALIEGMVERYLADFEARIDAQLINIDQPTAVQWARAYITASLEPDPEGMAVSAALLAAVAVNLNLLQPMQTRYAVWQAKLDALSDPSTVWLIRLALDGLWITDLLLIAPPTLDQRHILCQRLLMLLEP
jgi:AcrR family transcriptional regulator